ncbi:MAG: acyl carrier protein [Oscillospiraceae bacterium]|nr:acyl carrier protein [Oscillospiraceae bacterium]
MIFEKLQKMLAEQFVTDEDNITMDTQFIEDLGADSLDLVELTMAVEEEFGLPEIGEEDIQKLVTVGDVVRYISGIIE